MKIKEKKILAKEKGVNLNTINSWIRNHGEDYARKRIPATKSQAAKIGKNKSPWKNFKI